MVKVLAKDGLNIEYSVLCFSEKEWEDVQYMQFKSGYEWYDGRRTIYYPFSKLNFKDGVTIIINRRDKKLSYRESKFTEGTISFKKYVKDYYNTDKKQIVNFVNDIFKGDVV